MTFRGLLERLFHKKTTEATGSKLYKHKQAARFLVRGFPRNGETRNLETSRVILPETGCGFYLG